MRKPRGTEPGRLAKVITGTNRLFSFKFGPLSYFLSTPLFTSKTSSSVGVISTFRQEKATIPVGSIVLILKGKRTRVRQGAIPYFIILYEKKSYKIDASCISFDI
jgi:hypothetical protein